MSAWQDTADGHYCTVHQFAFKRLEVCHECTTAGDVGDEPPIAEYDRKLLARIESYRADARTMKRIALDLFEGTERDYNAGCKLMAEVTKLHRLAEERQELLDNREHDLELIRHEQEMSGLRGSH